MTATHSFAASTVIESGKVNTNFSELGMLPGGYAQATTNQGSITTEVDLTSLSVTVTISTAFAAAARKIKITGHVQMSGTVAADSMGLRIKESTTQLQQAEALESTASRGVTMIAIAVITPTSGSHTYKLSALRVAGTGTLTMGASTTQPAFILVEAV